MAKKQTTLIDGKTEESVEEKGTEEESKEPKEEKELTEEEKTKAAEVKAKEKEELRAEIVKELKAKAEAAASEKERLEKDKKEEIPQSTKNFADSLRKKLGDDYPDSFNTIKIENRIVAMMALIESLEKIKEKQGDTKVVGKGAEPKPPASGSSNEGSGKKDIRFTPKNSFKALRESWDNPK